MTTQTKTDTALISHLFRRAAFGASRDEIDDWAARGYGAAVSHLIDPPDTEWPEEFLSRRFHFENSGMLTPRGGPTHWLYRMITTRDPLREKVALFWHGIFATGYPKVIHGKALSDQIRMFRQLGMGRFDDLLLELARDPAMIVWLDNQDNHKDAINENWGRELLELFSMGVGNYSEDDIKECARAFTGWTLANTEYMVLRSMRDSDWPYGRLAWRFEYRPEDHDDGEKTFLGHTGDLNGEDIVGIICKQEATGRFIARHMYHFFVADEPPVPSWPYTPPRDPEAVDALAQAYFDSDHDIGAMLETLFNSDFFKDEDIRFEKVKGPAEFVTGVLRLTGEFDRPRREIIERYDQTNFMGQMLTNPPSVEGWHQGVEWIDTGTLIERINFASEQFGDETKPGVRAMVDSIMASTPELDADELVELCLDHLGGISMSDETRAVIREFADDGEQAGELSRAKVAQLLRLAAATHDFQRA